MDNVVFRSECGLDYIGVTVLHSVTDYISFGVCIHCSITSVVVDSRAYAVAITGAEIPCPECVGIVVYEKTAACGTKWGGIIVKWFVEVFQS